MLKTLTVTGALWLASVSAAAAAEVLLVVGTIPVSTEDARVVNLLQQRGHTVQVVDDDASVTASADGKQLVILSASVSAGSVGNKFNQVAVPMIVYKLGLYGSLGLTGNVESTDYGSVPSQTKLRMKGTHALTGGLVGTVTVSTAGSSFSWGKPGAAAVVAATINGDASRPAIFGYERGALLANSTTAPARRVATYLNAGAVTKWTANAQTLFTAAVQWAINGPPPAPLLRILPLGDSITRGSGGYWSFRRDLAGLLTNAKCTYDMVGTLFGPLSGRPGSGNFDRDHEGHSGYRTDQILSPLRKWLAGNVPDWVLIHLGTNDVLQAQSTATARANLSAIIDTLRAANADVGILLAQIIPNRPENEAAVINLNTAISDLAAAKDTGISPVILVDQYSGYDTFANNFDGVHPNATGEAIIAGRWYDALHPQIAAHCEN